MTPSLSPAPAFAGPEEGTRHLRAQSLSVPAGLSLEFGAVANTFLAFFLQHGGDLIQVMLDQTTTAFRTKKTSVVAFVLTFCPGNC